MIAQALLALAAVAAGALDDPFIPLPAGAPTVQRLVRAARFGEPGADPALAAWLRETPGAPTADRRLASEWLCTIEGARSLHAARARDCGALDPSEAPVENRASLLALRDVPPVRTVGSASVALQRNAWGGASAPVSVRGVTLLWFVDTGAQISVLAESTADRLKPRRLGAFIEAGTSTEPVRGEVAVLDLLRIGDAFVENVPVMILPDRALAVSGGAVIPAILGLQVFTAFRRMAFLDHGSVLALGEAAPPAGPAPDQIYWHKDGIGVRLGARGGSMGAHFDTGANQTGLHPAFEALLGPQERARAVERQVHLGGAGGLTTRRERQYPSVSVSLAGVRLDLAGVSVDATSDADGGRVGMDVVFPTDRFVVDFDRMTVSVEGAGAKR